MKKRRSVALLVETSNGYSRGLLDGVIAYTKQRTDWSIYLTEQERGAPPPGWLSDWNGDGIIARIETEEIAERLTEFGLPMVDLSATRYAAGVPWADTDDEAIARLGIEHFIERGFKHIAFCGDPGFAWSNARCEHCRCLAKAFNREFHEHQSIPRYASTFSWDAEKERLASWLRQTPRPLAIMACYDFKAQQVLDVCRQLSIAVPEEVAVLGVDNDHLICELAEPSLSSIIPNTKRTGYEAAELLERMMSGEVQPTPVKLLTQPLGIRTRESTDILAIEDQDVAAALRYIRQHATANIRVVDVLRHVSVSRRILESRFAAMIGRTPHAEIQRVRVNRIKELLSETDLSIAQIARRTGFEHGEYMAAAFKRETGKTPTEFRITESATDFPVNASEGAIRRSQS